MQTFTCVPYPFAVYLGRGDIRGPPTVEVHQKRGASFKVDNHAQVTDKCRRCYLCFLFLIVFLRQLLM